MPVSAPLSEEALTALRQFDTCTIANAIEKFQIRLRNTGFTNASVHCRFPHAGPMLGYAVTARLRTEDPPITGFAFHNRTDFWNAIQRVPRPSVLVLEDMDPHPGRGAFVGDVHAAILKALGCVGHVTNGAVREVPSVGRMGLQLFSGNLAVSHAYAHIYDVGSPVEVGGMEVHAGDLLHGDLHGVLNIPLEIAAEVPGVASTVRSAEQRVIDFCSSSEFSVSKLSEITKTVE